MSGKTLRIVKVRDLRPNSRWFTITVKVLKIGDERNVLSRKDGQQHRVAEAVVGDETGVVLMTLWDEDIDKAKELVGSTIRITNGFTTLYRGSLRLALSRHSSFEKVQSQITNVNENLNISESIR